MTGSRLERLACLGLAFAAVAPVGGSSRRDLASAAIARGQANHHVAVYRGKLGPHGRIQLDIAGSRARVYFTVQCREEGRAVGHALVGTYPPEATEPYFEPVSGYLRSGRVAIDVEQPGESKDEARAAPTAHVRLHARSRSTHVSGIFSMDVEEGGTNVFGEP